MSNLAKRSQKQPQRPRKKVGMTATPPKTANMQTFRVNGELGVFSNPHLTYHLARYFVGSVGEVYTSGHIHTGVIRAISVEGGFGMKSVRSRKLDSTDEQYDIVDEMIIPLTEIQKVDLRNVDPLEVQKDDLPEEVSGDPAVTMEHFFRPEDEAEAFSLTSDEHFDPADMFLINQQKYNVTSSYKEDLEGYTCPLDKSDPNFKEKEQYYSKIAQEIEGSASGLDKLADMAMENEELKYSAVIRDGQESQDFRAPLCRGSRRGGRGGGRPHPRELADGHRAGESRQSIKTSVGMHSDRTVKIQNTSVEPKLSGPDSSVGKTMSVKPKPAQDSASAIEDAALASSSVNEIESSKPTDGTTKKETKKKYTLDPDAPEFKPSGMLHADGATAAVTVPHSPSPYTPPVQCPPIPVSAFAVPSQPLANGANPQAVPFSLASSVQCMVPPTMASQFAGLRQPQPMSFNHQQLAMMTQHLSVSNALPSQSTAGPSTPGPKGQRQNMPAYGRQRSMDQANSAAHQIPLPMFPAQPFLLMQPSYTPIMPAGNLPSGAYPAVIGTVPVSQSPGQAVGGQHAVHNPPGQAPSGQQSSVPGQGQQFHPGYNAQMHGQPASIAAYTQYPAGQLIGAQPPGALGFYHQSAIYPHSGLIPFSNQFVGTNGQPQVGPQVHHQGQQSVVSPQPLQLQPSQPHGTVQQQQAQQQQQYINHVLAQHFFAQQLMNAHPQPLAVPQNVHGQQQAPPQPHTMQMYMPQQSNGGS